MTIEMMFLFRQNHKIEDKSIKTRRDVGGKC